MLSISFLAIPQCIEHVLKVTHTYALQKAESYISECHLEYAVLPLQVPPTYPPSAAPSLAYRMTPTPCISANYICSAGEVLSISPAVFQAAMNATICVPTGGSMCAVGSVQIQSSTWNAIKTGACQLQCQGDCTESQVSSEQEFPFWQMFLKSSCWLA